MLPVDGRQLENVKRELLKLKKKEASDCQLWHNLDRTEETEEHRNSRFSDMAQRGQERRAEETEEQRNSRLSDKAQRGQETKPKAEKTKE
ncbi:hypothetical protein AVEN_23259-1 [Araneus ventricosus]|uniref:STPR domain-containing protein n=1 Tax=Araneus ventricosus TaxID=182803 RepID=A0A4Y2K3P7_ARAVE|nr:hypothetical protein AVEN_23259-1 [Araneus ventricosus]